jgi:phage terminase large subunit
MFIRTTAINKLRKLNKFIKGVQGGTSAGKTFGIIPIEIDYAAKNPFTETSIVAESIPHLKRGAMKDFIKIMKQTNRWQDSRWNASDFKYTFANGSFIEFFSADTDAKLRGARRDRLYINECNNVSFHAYTELAMRTKQSVYLDCNPTAEFWFHTDLQNDTDVDFIILNYKDNEAAPQSAIDFIEKARVKSETSDFWKNWYQVYGLGLIGRLQGVVFENWSEIKEVPKDARLLFGGIDFGFATSKFAALEVYQFNGQYIINELLYETQLTNQDAASRLIANGYKQGTLMYCDSAEPKSIEELRRAGINAVKCDSKTDIKQFAIQKLNAKEFLVSSSSKNLINELRYYVWDEKTGKPKKSELDHLMDGLLYSLGSDGKYSGNYL